MPENKVDVYAYSDFRKYLQDAYAERHAVDRNFSYRFLAESLGDKSPSFLTKVLRDGRRLTPPQLEKLAVILRLNIRETRYFRVLYLYSMATERSERELYLEQLITLNHTPRRELARDMHEYYSHWYISTIRVALSLIDFKGEYKALARRLRPKITTQQAEDAVTLLKKLDLIHQDEDGCWRPADTALFAKDRFQADFLQTFRHQCLDLAHTALDSRHQAETHQFYTSCLSVSEDTYKRFLRRLESFRADVRAMVQKDPLPPTRLVQMQMQLFPILEDE